MQTTKYCYILNMLAMDIMVSERVPLCVCVCVCVCGGGGGGGGGG